MFILLILNPATKVTIGNSNPKNINPASFPAFKNNNKLTIPILNSEKMEITLNGTKSLEFEKIITIEATIKIEIVMKKRIFFVSKGIFL